MNVANETNAMGAAHQASTTHIEPEQQAQAAQAAAQAAAESKAARARAKKENQ